MVVNFTTFLLYKKENFHVGVFKDVKKQQKHFAHIHTLLTMTLKHIYQ